jgi:hypothetical protein
MQLHEPNPLNAVFFSYYDLTTIQPEIIDRCSAADIIIALGGVNLDLLAASIPPGKPALAVLGPKDSREVPQPFRPLHANGFSFRGWKIAGFSGAPRGNRVVPGNYIGDDEAEVLLSGLPACDILLTHAPPATSLRESEIRPDQGFTALDVYLRDKPPIYHFYAHPEGEQYEDLGTTMSIGVSGSLVPPALVYC